MSNIIIFPFSARRELTPESDMLVARDHLVTLLASLSDLNAELSMLLQKELQKALPQDFDEQPHPWRVQSVDYHRPDRAERQGGGT